MTFGKFTLGKIAVEIINLSIFSSFTQAQLVYILWYAHSVSKIHAT